MLEETLGILKRNPRLFTYYLLILIASYIAAFSLVYLNNLISSNSYGFFGIPVVIIAAGFLIGAISMLLLIAMYNDFKNRNVHEEKGSISKILKYVEFSSSHTFLLLFWGIVYPVAAILENVRQSGAYTIHFYIPGFIFPLALIPYVLERRIPREVTNIFIIVIQFYIIALNKLFIPASVAYSPVLNLVAGILFFTITTVYAFVRYEKIR